MLPLIRAFQLIFFVSDLALRDIYYVFGWDKAPCQKSVLRVYAYATSRPLKFYVVSYTYKADDLETIFEISYLQTAQKPKCTICYPYGPTNLQGKVWGHAASTYPRYNTSISWVFSSGGYKNRALEFQIDNVTIVVGWYQEVTVKVRGHCDL